MRTPISSMLSWLEKFTVHVFLHVLAEAEQEEGEPFWVFDCLILLSYVCAHTCLCPHVWRPEDDFQVSSLPLPWVPEVVKPAWLVLLHTD